jgi:hypothetical protein
MNFKRILGGGSMLKEIINKVKDSNMNIILMDGCYNEATKMIDYLYEKFSEYNSITLQGKKKYTLYEEDLENITFNKNEIIINL